jgi:hypothetical protein
MIFPVDSTLRDVRVFPRFHSFRRVSKEDKERERENPMVPCPLHLDLDLREPVRYFLRLFTAIFYVHNFAGVSSS